METGIHAKHRRQWVRKHLNCLTNNLIVHVGLEYTGSLFIMLLVGYILVLLIFIAELLWNRYNIKITNPCTRNLF